MWVFSRAETAATEDRGYDEEDCRESMREV
jgi:hypothetical protein